MILATEHGGITTIISIVQRYNDLWDSFFQATHTAEDAKVFARALAEIYGYEVNF